MRTRYRINKRWKTRERWPWQRVKAPSSVPRPTCRPSRRSVGRSGRAPILGVRCRAVRDAQRKARLSRRDDLEILTSVLRGNVDWQALPADVPPQVRLLMERCLEHEASGRLSDLGDARNVLRPLASPAFVTVVHTPADTKSIVVLPFANLSPDPDTGPSVTGSPMKSSPICRASQSLRVISRSSAMRLKGDARGLAAIGRDLACRACSKAACGARPMPSDHGPTGGRAERRPTLGQQVRRDARRRVRDARAGVTVDRGRPRNPAHAARGRAAC